MGRLQLAKNRDITEFILFSSFYDKTRELTKFKFVVHRAAMPP